MTKRISLALVVHNHQPVGNFGWVIEDVYNKAYEPMIGALERHPTIRLALHYTGPLLEWMAAERPESIERLRALWSSATRWRSWAAACSSRSSCRCRSAIAPASSTRMRDDVAARFGEAPRGAWLAERVWEPSLPFDLAAAGYEYTVLDDNHLRGAFVPEDQMWGTYTTDDQGKLLTIFGTEKGLRYRIPWRPVERPDRLPARQRDRGRRSRRGHGRRRREVRGVAGNLRAVLERRRSGSTAASRHSRRTTTWLTTVTPSTWMDDASAQRPHLHPDLVVRRDDRLGTAGRRAARLQPAHGARRDAGPARACASCVARCGATSRRAIARSTTCTSRCCGSRPRSRQCRPVTMRDRALDHLYRGQSNDCYWHGWFGGIYIVHMRMATLAELIAAEDLALGEDGVLSGAPTTTSTASTKSRSGPSGQTVIVDVAEGAGIGSWDLRASRLALASVLRRRPEPYHDQIIEAARQRRLAADRVVDDSRSSDLSKLIVYDDHERRSGLVRVFDESTDQRSASFDTERLDCRAGHRLQLVAASATRAACACARRSASTATDTMAIAHGRPSRVVAVDAVRRHARARMEPQPARRRRESRGVLPVRRRASGATTPPGPWTAGAELTFGNTYEGVDISLSADRRPRPRSGIRSRPCPTQSRASNASTRARASSSAGRCRLSADQSATFTTTMTSRSHATAPPRSRLRRPEPSWRRDVDDCW